MKTFFLLVLCIVVELQVHAQSFTAKTTSTSSNSKIITSGNNPIYKGSMRSSTQVQSDLNVDNNSINSYDVNFYTAPLTTENNSSTSNACLLQDDNGNTFTGTLKNDITQKNAAGIVRYSCAFSKGDFYKIAAVKKLTAIKIFSGDGKAGNFPVNNGLQETIMMQAKSLLAAFQK